MIDKAKQICPKKKKKKKNQFYFPEFNGATIL